jgi:hypothetical protein
MFAYATSTWKPGGLISYVPSQNDKFKLFTSYPAITLKHAAGGSSIYTLYKYHYVTIKLFRYSFIFKLNYYVIFKRQNHVQYCG